MPDAGVLATILLIVGLFLLALELMIPSFGMIGILAAVCLIISAWAAWSAWWTDSPGLFWTYASFWVLGIPSVLGGMLFILQNTSMGDHIVLRGPAVDVPATTETAEPRGLEVMIGRVGKAASMLRPGGMVTIDSQRFHAESPGMMLDSGSDVEVIDIKGNRLVVKVASAEAIAAEKAAAEKRKSPPEPEPDDFADTALKTEVKESLLADAGLNPKKNAILDFEIPQD